MIPIRQPKHSTTIVWFYSRFAHACGLPCRSNGSKAGPHTNASYAAGVRRIGVNECNRLITTIDDKIEANDGKLLKASCRPHVERNTSSDLGCIPAVYNPSVLRSQ